jgi:hypothetical protein
LSCSGHQSALLRARGRLPAPPVTGHFISVAMTFS